MHLRDLFEIDNPRRVPRQRDLFEPRPAVWQRRPVEKNVRYDTTGYYHVTPFLDRVLASGVLKSKNQLLQDAQKEKAQFLDQVRQSPEYLNLSPADRLHYVSQKEQEYKADHGPVSTGLGAGSHPHSNRTVSLTYSYERAREIFSQLQFLAAIVEGKAKASEIYDYITADYDWPFFEELSPVDQVLIDLRVPKRAVRDGKPGSYLDRLVVTPEQQYEFLQALERAMLADEQEHNSDWDDVDAELVNDDGTVAIAQGMIGFTAPFSAIRRIRSDNVGIIQCVVRKGADVEHVGEEVELRVDASDVAMIRYTKNPA